MTSWTNAYVIQRLKEIANQVEYLEDIIVKDLTLNAKGVAQVFKISLDSIRDSLIFDADTLEKYHPFIVETERSFGMKEELITKIEP